MNIPVVAIIGRPNVGKSTFFNCFAKQQKAIISDIPGTTRDSLIEKIEGDRFDYFLVDTAGLRNEAGDVLEQEIQAQVELTLSKADVIIFLIDGKSSLTSEDEEIVYRLRKSRTPFLFIANKIDDGNTHHLLELSRFGFGVPLAISAKNFVGLWEVEDAIENEIEKLGFLPREESDLKDSIHSPLKVAFIGRPNVGKSSLFNFLLGKKRSIVSDLPGTTRDSIGSDFVDEKGREFFLLDTAGLRKPGKIGKDIDFWSAVRTKRAIEASDVCVLLIDALDGVTHQDMALAGQIIEAGKGLLLGVNKFDLVREKSKTTLQDDDRDVPGVPMWGEDLDLIRQRYLSYLKAKLPFLPWAPVLFFSAKTGRGVSDIFSSLIGIGEERKKRISTSELNQFLPELFFGHVSPSKGVLQGKMKYVSQVDVCPPKFLFFVNNVLAFHFSYRRYLENKIREKYGFFGTPIIIELRDERIKEKSSRKKK